MKIFYRCDPKKYKTCKKRFCQDLCYHTCNKEYSKNGIPDFALMLRCLFQKIFIR